MDNLFHLEQKEIDIKQILQKPEIIDMLEAKQETLINQLTTKALAREYEDAVDIAIELAILRQQFILPARLTDG